MEGLQLLKVGGVPEIVVVDMPLLTRHLCAEIELEQQRIEADPHEFDGPVQIVLRADSDRIVVADARYSWWKVLRSSSNSNPYPWGGFGVALILQHGGGDILWSKRSSTVSAAGVWGFSAAGAVNGGTSPEQAVLGEAEEELGIRCADVQQLTPLFTVRGAVTSGQNGVLVVYRARLADGVELKPDPAEVAEICWQPSPEGLDPFGISSQLVWQMCRRRGFLDPRFLSYNRPA